MHKHFQWLLTCADDGTSYTLTNDPIGFEDCSFRMERHSTYHGIFNQFTSNLKFHNDGGGKQFIDAKYQLFDINGQINIEVLVDSDGNGLNYDTLFTGKLNLASYQNDGTHTTVNIEQSDIATKLNTRAGIPVPINVPVVTIPGQTPFKAVIMDVYDPQSNNNLTSGNYIFEDPQILKGKIFKIVTADINNNNLGASIYYTVNNQSSATVTGANGLSIQISNVLDDTMTITFANLTGTVTLYAVGAQLSLGQEIIQPVNPVVIPMQGIPIQYESEFSMADDEDTGTFVFIMGNNGWPGGAPINPGDLISVTTADTNSLGLYDQVLYAGVNIQGPGNTSSDGLTKVQITGITPTSVSVSFQNIYVNGAYGSLSLWKGSIGAVNAPNPGTGNPPGTNIANYTPASSTPEQIFPVPSTGTFNLNGTTVEGFIGFDANTVFDNLDEFTWGTYNDINAANVNTSNTQLPSILQNIIQPWMEFPVKVHYKVRLKGTFNENVGQSLEHLLNGAFTLAYGGGKAGVGIVPLSLANFITLGAIVTPSTNNVDVITDSYTWNFDIDTEGDIELQDGDQLWFYFYYRAQFLGGPFDNISYPLTFQFTQSDIDFQVTEYALPTTATGILIHEAFNQVADMIADTDGNFYSEFYGRTDSQKVTYAQNGEGSARMLTNGLCIRGKTDKYISISLNDLFESMAAIDNIGMEINSSNQLRVEPLSYFFDPTTQIALLPNVYAFNTRNENSLYYNQIEVGYDKWETELYFKNGLDDVHGKRYLATRVATAKGTVLQKYGTDVKSLIAVSNKLSAVSKFIAGNYAIELTRRKNFQWATDDFKYDNDNFIICVSRSLTAPASFLTSGGNAININGMDLSYLSIGDTITVTGSAHNNATLTISNVVIEYSVNGTPTSIIFVSQTLTQELTATPTLHRLRHPANAN